MKNQHIYLENNFCLLSPVYEIDTEAQGIDLNVKEDLFQKATGYMVDICVFDDHYRKAMQVKVTILCFWYKAKMRNLFTRCKH